MGDKGKKDHDKSRKQNAAKKTTKSKLARLKTEKQLNGSLFSTSKGTSTGS